MTEIDLSRAEGHKSGCSSRSGHCLEVARNQPGLEAVRHSKQPGDTKLVVSQKTWRVFVDSVRV